jgi:hypothetical protein
MAVCLIAIWPNWILLSGLASKELLVAALLSSAVWVHVGAPTWKRALGVGALCGAIALTQPSALMLPVVFIVGDAIRGLDYRLLTRRALVLPIGMMIVVGPWTARNYLVFHQFIPVSSNGGITLWVANHPGATGQHVRVPDRLAELPELERARVASREALQWMRDHPARVVVLALHKQALFWADDAKGAYESMRRPERYGDRAYTIVKGISNIFWIGLLMVLVAGTLRFRRPDPAASLLLTTILGLLVYFESFQLVFEGDGRFHTPLMPLLAVAVVCTLANASSRDNRLARAVERAGS